MGENVSVGTSDGETLKGELFVPEAPRAAIVITHPHPKMGGDHARSRSSSPSRLTPPLSGRGTSARGVGGAL